MCALERCCEEGRDSSPRNVEQIANHFPGWRAVKKRQSGDWRSQEIQKVTASQRGTQTVVAWNDGPPVLGGNGGRGFRTRNKSFGRVVLECCVGC